MPIHAIPGPTDLLNIELGGGDCGYSAVIFEKFMLSMPHSTESSSILHSEHCLLHHGFFCHEKRNCFTGFNFYKPAWGQASALGAAVASPGSKQVSAAETAT